jgi:hypothetical protein
VNWEAERRMAKDVEENPELYEALADCRAETWAVLVGKEVGKE